MERGVLDRHRHSCPLDDIYVNILQAASFADFVVLGDRFSNRGKFSVVNKVHLELNFPCLSHLFHSTVLVGPRTYQDLF